MWLTAKQEVERHQDRAGEVRSEMSSERCVLKTLALWWATDLVFQEPWGHIVLMPLPDGPFFIPAHYSYCLGWSVLILTQVPPRPALCLPQGELPQTDAEVPAGKPAEQRSRRQPLLSPAAAPSPAG